MKIATGFLGRIFLASHSASLEATQSGLHVEMRDAIYQISYPELGPIKEQRGFLGTTIEFSILDGPRTRFTVKGLPKRPASIFLGCILAWQVGQEVDAALAQWRQLMGQDRFVNHSTWERLKASQTPLLAKILKQAATRSLPPKFAASLKQLRDVITEGERPRLERNERYLVEEGERQKAWFDQLEAYPLTQRQREAIICDEDNILVVAGAGTGKTSTIVGKVGYLLRKRFAAPDRILLLAFARKARDEMKDRLVAKFGPGVAVKTFHSLGLEIIAEVRGTRPTLSKLADDDALLRQTMGRFLEEMGHDPIHGEALRKFLLYYRYPRRNENDFETQHEYCGYLKSQGLRTLKGEAVKSLGELLIADFLTAHGVEYQYEADYEHKTATPEFRQYRPDFYLPGVGLYIEYFGVDRQGKTARYINARAYQEGMVWKRDLHRQRKTKLLEFFSYELWEGQLETCLAERLREVGVVLNPVTPGQLMTALKTSKELDRVVGLVCTFLGLFKSNGWTAAEIQQRAAKVGDAQRADHFLRLFGPIQTRYNAELSRRQEVDFHDLIAEAATLIESGRFRSQFTHILVDEFQDISRGRGRLLRALLAQQADRRLFCVGDDWQSIYRFTGSDISLMTDFSAQFGFTRRVDLDRTFRFTREILDASVKFVLKNSKQLRKELVAQTFLGRPAVRILCERTDDPDGSGLERALAEILSQSAGEPASVMILGRYHFCLPEALSRLRKKFAPLALESRTVHASKGLEADYVVILGMNAGRYGFPTEVSDDPLLELVLADDSGYPNAEERRLFYVALTRARKQAILVTDEASRSRFVEELEGTEYQGLVEREEHTRSIGCPTCQGGQLVKRTGEHGMFWSCSNYPYCDGRVQVCFKCGDGALVQKDGFYICSNQKCDARVEACPRCQQGLLKERRSQYGLFLSCSNWRPEGTSCDYKRDLLRHS